MDHPPVVLCLYEREKKRRSSLDWNDRPTTILSVNIEGRRGDTQEPETVCACVCVLEDNR